MSAFWNKNDQEKGKDTSKKAVQGKAVKDEKKVPKKKKEKKRVIPQEKADLINRTLVQPKISEAALREQEIGKYVFIVAKSANKTQVREAVEAMYGVSVKKINLIKYNAKKRSFRGLQGKNAGFKKAIVTLIKGESIDFFSAKK
ncbi:MAG TPA: 50S ribosomal protein L23 [Candidatus Moranbacteria bacterium]|nr:50S ribosomal protein L23 [Candidatus Moranbacteria bacterium]